MKIGARIILSGILAAIILVGFQNCNKTSQSLGQRAPASAWAPNSASSSLKNVQGSATANVRDFGALGDGKDDDTAAFKAAIASLGTGGVLTVPVGNYVVSDTLSVATPISIIGIGFGSQILETANVTLFSFQGVQAATVSDLYLGSVASAPGASLIELTNSHRNRVVNVTMLGGYYGLYLHGSLLNTIEDLRSGTDFQGFFGATSANQYWVYADAVNSVSANANTFIAPVLEGGVNGIYLTDPAGQGSLYISGGTIEGVSGSAITFQHTFLPSSVTGLHMEANAGADVVIQDSCNVRLYAILALTGIKLIESNPALAPRNISISDSTVEHITIPPDAKRIRIVNITTCLQTGDSGSGITNNVPANAIDAYDGTPSVIMSQIGPYCSGQ